MQSLIQVLFLVCMLSMQTGCSFKLKSSHHIPKQLNEIRFSSYQQYSELSRLIRRNMRYHNIDLNPKQPQGVTSIRVTRDLLERSTLSLFQNGTIAEYELTYTVTYTVTIPKQDTLTQSVIVRRQYTDDLSSSLAKSSEVRQVTTGMRQKAAELILSQLIALYTQPISQTTHQG